jgi:hypothetical protein
MRTAVGSSIFCIKSPGRFAIALGGTPLPRFAQSSRLSIAPMTSTPTAAIATPAMTFGTGSGTGGGT